MTTFCYFDLELTGIINEKTCSFKKTKVFEYVGELDSDWYNILSEKIKQHYRYKYYPSGYYNFDKVDVKIRNVRKIDEKYRTYDDIEATYTI
jgi:hypothetical protein